MDIEIKKLTIHSDDKGYLFEGLRNDDKIFSGKFGQSLISILNPGVIKGLHRHSKQIDYTLCAKGNIKYCVCDGKNVKSYIIGEKNPVLIKVPPGLWHGYMAIDDIAIIFHIMDRPYNPKDDDTDRLDPYAFGDIWS